jgi:peptide/nickel transport system substrate-binding protein
MMPKRVAELDPMKQLEDTTGSGPFIFKKDEWKPGEKVVYVKNPKYKPRSEPMSGLSGGKAVSIDRVEWVWIPDSETQLNALLNGEIDMIESVSYDHLPVLEKNSDIRVIVGKTSNQYVFRMNWLQPPFNNKTIRQAVTYALNQEEFLQANIGDNRFYRVCKAMFTCDTSLSSTAGMDGLIEGNAAKARELLKEAGYDGTVVVIPQPTDLGVIKQLAPVAKSQLEKAGFKVEVQPMDWQSMVTRLTADDTESRHDLRKGARGLAVRRGHGEAARQVRGGDHARGKKGGRRRGAALRHADRHPHSTRRVVQRLRRPLQYRHHGRAAAHHRLLGRDQEVGW